MLNVIEYGKDEYDFPALLVLGCFDAIHVGHRDLIKKAKLQAKINGLDLGVMLFRDGKGGKTVYSFEERLAILEEFNVKFVLVMDFNEQLKNTSPEDFLHAVEDKVNVKAYMSGKDFRFGAKAKGKSSTLKNYAEDEDNGVWYMPVKDVTAGDEKISTTQIKECLEKGEVAKANELLGSEFFVSGEVIKGEGRGASRLGYPTANVVYPQNKCEVKQGVYIVKSKIDENEYFGIANYGNCPTFGDERIALEVHYARFNGDLYGKTIEVRFLDYLRDIATFGSVEELAAQLDEDKKALMAYIVAYKEKAAAEAAKAPAAQPVQHPVAAEVANTPAADVTAEPVQKPVVEEVAQHEEAVAEEIPQPVEAVDAPAEPEVEQSAQEAVTEEISQPEEVVAQPEEAVAEEVAQPEEEVAEPAEAVTEEVSESEVSAEEFKALDSGFDDVAEEVVEVPEEPEAAEPEQTEEVAEVPEEPEATEPEQAEEVAEVPEEPEVTEAAEPEQTEEVAEVPEEPEAIEPEQSEEVAEVPEEPEATEPDEEAKVEDNSEKENEEGKVD